MISRLMHQLHAAIPLPEADHIGQIGKSEETGSILSEKTSREKGSDSRRGCRFYVGGWRMSRRILGKPFCEA
jgi:hypothetical protein